MGLTKSQKKEMQNPYVINPAITMLTMTTPDDFFNTVGIEAVKDGFINRFIICISDAQRTLGKRTEFIAVPESIIAWEKEIKIRRGNGDESCLINPSIVTLNFSEKCSALQKDFDQYCMDAMNANEKFGLEAISGRSAEMALRLSLIIALSENPNATEITATHTAQAIGWVKYNLNRLVKELKTSVSGSKHEGGKKEILKALRACGGISLTDMFKRPPFSKYERKILNEMLSELYDSELATKEIEQKEGAGNRKTIWKAL